MNEKRFIQLINLYIDEEISPEELEELESEVSRDKRRRRIYRNYCLLQKASQVVCRKMGPALNETVDLKKYHILSKNWPRRLRLGLIYSAGAMAAACLTVLAAISLLKEPGFGAMDRDYAFEPEHGSVEVFTRTSRKERSDQMRVVSVSQSEPFFFAGRPTGRSHERSGFLEPVRTASRDSFRPAAGANSWETGFPGGSSPNVIGGDSSFEIAPELTSFQFQR